MLRKRVRTSCIMPNPESESESACGIVLVKSTQRYEGLRLRFARTWQARGNMVARLRALELFSRRKTAGTESFCSATVEIIIIALEAEIFVLLFDY